MAIRYTQTAKNALNKSLEFARELGHTYIGSEHILLGLLSETDGVAAKIVINRGITYEAARKVIEDTMGTGEPTTVTPNDMTPRTKRIIENSARESQKYGQNYIGTEHIMLALIAEADCVAVRILTTLGASVRDIANDIISFFREFSEPGMPSEDGGQAPAQPAGGARTRSYGTFEGRQARSDYRTRNRNREADSDSLPPHKEQPVPHRRAGRRQDCGG
jgi:ATP-dependent Clp protease ATP-binding subunit ClpC